MFEDIFPLAESVPVRRNSKKWESRRGPGFADVKNRVLHVPTGESTGERHIRFHELTHAYITPRGLRRPVGLPDHFLQRAEDARCNAYGRMWGASEFLSGMCTPDDVQRLTAGLGFLPRHEKYLGETISAAVSVQGTGDEALVRARIQEVYVGDDAWIGQKILSFARSAAAYMDRAAASYADNPQKGFGAALAVAKKAQKYAAELAQEIENPNPDPTPGQGQEDSGEGQEQEQSGGIPEEESGEESEGESGEDSENESGEDSENESGEGEGESGEGEGEETESLPGENESGGEGEDPGEGEDEGADEGDPAPSQGNSPASSEDPGEDSEESPEEGESAGEGQDLGNRESVEREPDFDFDDPAEAAEESKEEETVPLEKDRPVGSGGASNPNDRYEKGGNDSVARSVEKMEDLALTGTYRNRRSPDGIVEWCPMETVIPNMPLRLPPKLRGRRIVASDTGASVRFPHRDEADGAIFGERGKKPGGATILIDGSGSTRITAADVERILELAPAAKIAIYGGQGRARAGQLRIIAQKGRRVRPTQTMPGEYGDLPEGARYMDPVTREWRFAPEGGLKDMLLAQYGGNDVDGPALDWLRQQSGPRYWISDGMVVSAHGITREALLECARKCKQGRIRRIDTIRGLLEILADVRKGRTKKNH